MRLNAPRQSIGSTSVVTGVCLAIAIYCFAWPEAVLDEPMYDRLPSKAGFGYALGTIFWGSGALFGGRERAEQGGRSKLATAAVNMGGLMVIGGFGYVLWAIFTTSGPPW